MVGVEPHPGQRQQSRIGLVILLTAMVTAQPVLAAGIANRAGLRRASRSAVRAGAAAVALG